MAAYWDLDPAMPPIRAIIHASLRVQELPRALAFYCDVLGLEIVTRPDLGYPGAWLTLPSGQQIHLLAVGAEPAAGALRQPGRDRHLALAVSDLPGLARRLAAAGVPVVPSRSGRQALFCRDPDGNALEFLASEDPPSLDARETDAR